MVRTLNISNIVTMVEIPDCNHYTAQRWTNAKNKAICLVYFHHGSQQVKQYHYHQRDGKSFNRFSRNREKQPTHQSKPTKQDWQKQDWENSKWKQEHPVSEEGALSWDNLLSVFMAHQTSVLWRCLRRFAHRHGSKKDEPFKTKLTPKIDDHTKNESHFNKNQSNVVKPEPDLIKPVTIY